MDGVDPCGMATACDLVGGRPRGRAPYYSHACDNCPYGEVVNGPMSWEAAQEFVKSYIRRRP